MTDTEWAAIRLPLTGWLRGRGGRPEGYWHRTMLNAVRYLVDNGILTAALPFNERVRSADPERHGIQAQLAPA
ncbi:hypothetical protein ACWGJB_29715 [Streptomyces sp. NPDC054813]